jgi:hypothetical protein
VHRLQETKGKISAQPEGDNSDLLRLYSSAIGKIPLHGISKLQQMDINQSMNSSIHKVYSRFPNHSVYNGFA